MYSAHKKWQGAQPPIFPLPAALNDTKFAPHGAAGNGAPVFLNEEGVRGDISGNYVGQTDIRLCHGVLLFGIFIPEN